MGIRLIVAAQERWAKGLNGNEYKLLMLLCEQANEHTREVWPEFDKGASSIVFRRFGGSRTAIYKALNGLVEKGAVGRVKHGQKHQNAVLRILVSVETSQGPENRDAEAGSGSRFLSLRVPETGTPSPQSPNPSPPPPPREAAACAPMQRGGGGEIDEEINITVARVREIRPDWRPAKIREILQHPDVVERGGTDLARTAMLLIAPEDGAYGKTTSPGRLAHDGPWWGDAVRALRGAPSGAPVPERCSDPRHISDNPRDRRLYDDLGVAIGRCPKCYITEGVTR